MNRYKLCQELSQLINAFASLDSCLFFLRANTFKDLAFYHYSKKGKIEIQFKLFDKPFCLPKCKLKLDQQHTDIASYNDDIALY